MGDGPDGQLNFDCQVRETETKFAISRENRRER